MCAGYRKTSADPESEPYDNPSFRCLLIQITSSKFDQKEYYPDLDEATLAEPNPFEHVTIIHATASQIAQVEMVVGPPVFHSPDHVDAPALGCRALLQHQMRMRMARPQHAQGVYVQSTCSSPEHLHFTVKCASSSKHCHISITCTNCILADVSLHVIKHASRQRWCHPRHPICSPLSWKDCVACSR